MTLVRTESIDFGYTKDVTILKGIDLEMCNPQLISIIGPNGAGKTTLIHCINRLLSPTKGTVLLDGEDVASYRPKELARKIGYVPYTSGDSFPLTVVDTVLMGRNPHRRWNTMHEDMKVVEKALEMMDISDLAMRPFNELSTGQHQRVMLARGLAQEPEILLLDEPTSNLDIRHQMEVIRLLKKQTTSQGIMVIMISHDINIAAKYSDSIIMMCDGRVFAVGTPGEVITRENMKAVYGVDVDILDFGGRPHVVLRDGEFTETDSLRAEGSYVVSGASLRCAFRPGDLVLQADRAHSPGHSCPAGPGARVRRLLTHDRRPRPRLPAGVLLHRQPHPGR